jgi:geranylgeranyl diphosphate synthase type II
MHSENYFRIQIEAELAKLNLNGKPSRLYDPIRYMISLGGKRLRPSLLMMSHELFGGNPEDAIQPALAIEVFHNFTLLHDDIMDKAPLRRSRETVHKKWNPDIAILSGDTMFVQSCQLMMNVNQEYVRNVLTTFFKTAISVCEGQQMDMDFESEINVSIEEYLNMIHLKTASLIGCSAYIGAICAGASKENADHLYEFGKNLGIAFQLHDDLLDVYGDAEKFGKQVGGDILANKKTYLLLTALQKSSGNIKSELQHLISSNDFIPEKKIEAVISIYEKLDVKRHATEKMEYFFRNALDELEEVSTLQGSKDALLDLAERLMIREK